jgi:hypothetical protein
VLAGVLGLVALALAARFVGVHCFSVRVRPVERSAELVRATRDVKGYFRTPSSTYLALPAWYVVTSADEYAVLIKARAPSRFPYFAAIRQYWRYYRGACRGTKRVYPFDPRAHLALGAIGLGFSIENALQGGYEKTFGRVTEALGFYQTEEDGFARKTAREYAEFVRTAPGHDFAFGEKLGALWRETPFWGSDPVRKWERRLALSAEYALKASSAWALRLVVDRRDDVVIHAWIDDAPDRIFADDRIRKVKPVGPGSYLVTLPRGEAFTGAVAALARQGVRFRDLAGNDEILLTAIAPRAWDSRLATGTLLFSEEILTNPGAKRIALRAPVTALHVLLADLPGRGASVERLYPY